MAERMRPGSDSWAMALRSTWLPVAWITCGNYHILICNHVMYDALIFSDTSIGRTVLTLASAASRSEQLVCLHHASIHHCQHMHSTRKREAGQLQNAGADGRGHQCVDFCK